MTAARCECCGRDLNVCALNITFSHEQSTILCTFCTGLIESGLVRPEGAEGGRTVYRLWRMEWTPGELVGS